MLILASGTDAVKSTTSDKDVHFAVPGNIGMRVKQGQKPAEIYLTAKGDSMISSPGT